LYLSNNHDVSSFIIADVVVDEEDAPVAPPPGAFVLIGKELRLLSNKLSPFSCPLSLVIH